MRHRWFTLSYMVVAGLSEQEREAAQVRSAALTAELGQLQEHMHAAKEETHNSVQALNAAQVRNAFLHLQASKPLSGLCTVPLSLI